MIAIVDYGVGNVSAFLEVYRTLGMPAIATGSAEELAQASHVILPGVGAFDQAMARLTQSGLVPVLREMVKDRGVPLLGVCVGMQMLTCASDEGCLPGLGWIPGRTLALSSFNSTLRVPHMGWNDVRTVKTNPLLDIEQAYRFYFLHSYYVDLDTDADVIAQTDYGNSFSCAFRFENIYGVQFHPEKSHDWGRDLLRRFGQVERC